MYAMRYNRLRAEKSIEHDLLEGIFYVTEESSLTPSACATGLQIRSQGMSRAHHVRNAQGNSIEVQIRTSVWTYCGERLASHWPTRHKGEHTLDTRRTSVRYALEHKAETNRGPASGPLRGNILLHPYGRAEDTRSRCHRLDFAFNIHSGLG